MGSVEATFGQATPLAYYLFRDMFDEDYFGPWAQAEGLIENSAANTLGEKLYVFRNSIVHGKFSFGYAVEFGSAIEKSENIKKWRNLLRELERVFSWGVGFPNQQNSDS